MKRYLGALTAASHSRDGAGQRDKYFQRIKFPIYPNPQLLRRALGRGVIFVHSAIAVKTHDFHSVRE
jgi:hypothetical protein